MIVITNTHTHTHTHTHIHTQAGILNFLAASGLFITGGILAQAHTRGSGETWVAGSVFLVAGKAPAIAAITNTTLTIPYLHPTTLLTLY
jgi:hypothetical protein